MLYQIEHGTVSRGGHIILSDFNFEIHGNEKIAVVGRNGSGKSTLLSVIAGELMPDADDRYPSPIRISRKVTVDILRQTPVTDPQETVENHLLAAYLAGKGLTMADSSKNTGSLPCDDSAEKSDVFWQLSEKERFDFEAEYDRMFTGFGFSKEDKAKRMGEFSGGQQTRIALIRLLLSRPDILLLDEPTNHLDVEACEWLENYFRCYDKAVVMVSHDRYFLDQTADVVVEIHRGKLTRYSGNYTQYRQEQAEKVRLQMRRYEEQQEEIRRLEELILRFRNKPKKAAFARSRQKILERMEIIEKPETELLMRKLPEIRPASGCAKWVWESEHLKMGYDPGAPLHEISFRIRRGKKIGVIGVNGSGKSTFLKTVAGKLEPLSGKIRTGNGVDIAYFDQNTAAISSDDSVLDHFRGRYPSLNEKEARQILAVYGFSGRDTAKKVSELSGGEKTRLVLCILLQAGPNFLILDEPTNHMDMEGMEMLERCLQAYTGTMLLVSHDRYFLDRTVDSLLVFPKEGDILYYPFGYDHYKKRGNKTEAEGGQNASAARSAEEQALIEGLKAVPKGESRRLREISTEAAYEDWRFRLVKEQLEQAETDLEKILGERETERYAVDPDHASFVDRRAENYRDRVTGLLLEWYDLVLEFDRNVSEEEIQGIGEQ